MYNRIRTQINAFLQEKLSTERIEDQQEEKREEEEEKEGDDDDEEKNYSDTKKDSALFDIDAAIAEEERTLEIERNTSQTNSFVDMIHQWKTLHCVSDACANDLLVRMRKCLPQIIDIIPTNLKQLDKQ